jgi:hypothetical protein
MVACSGEDRVIIRERSELGERLGTGRGQQAYQRGH